MIWETKSLKFFGPTIYIYGRKNHQDYLKFFGNKVHPIAREIFLERNVIFYDDNVSIPTTKVVSVSKWHKEHSS